MNRLSPRDFQVRELLLDRERADGLLLTCAADCFAPDALARELTPGAWLVHRTPGNIVPPFGAGHPVEEALLERAITEFGVGTVVVCGHHPCGVANHLLTPDAPADDFLLRDWLSHAEAARRCVAGLDGAGGERAAAAHNVLAQLTNLRTHPAVAAALAHGSLRLWGWLHVGELLCSGTLPTAFDRPVVLQPDQNCYLRRERRQQRPSPLSCNTPPYLA